MSDTESGAGAVTAVPDATLDALAEVLTGRRTINLFADEPVPEGVLIEAIDMARWAPNHRLTQPWRFRLLGTQARAAVMEADIALARERNGEQAAQRRRERLEAIPGWFVVTSARAEDPLVEQENYAATCCAVQNLSLYLWARGVGVKWSTGPVTRDGAFFRAVGVDPEREQVVGLFWYGYPAMVPQQKRAPVDELVERLP